MDKNSNHNYYYYELLEFSEEDDIIWSMLSKLGSEDDRHILLDIAKKFADRSHICNLDRLEKAKELHDKAKNINKILEESCQLSTSELMKRLNLGKKDSIKTIQTDE